MHIKHKITTIVVILLFITLSAIPGHSAAQKGKLRLTIIDQETGEIVPARVQITDSDGVGYGATDALLVGGDCHMPSHPEFDPAEYSFEQALGRLSKTVSDPFTDITQFYSTGKSAIALPAGTVKIKILKGPEYYINEDQITITAGKVTSKTLKLSRWVNMPKRGWYSADDHLHIPRYVPNLNPFVLKMMQAEDIHVGNLLQMGREYNNTISPQYAFGKKSIYQEGNYIIASGQENQRSHLLGHTVTLGAKEALHDTEQYLIYRKLWEKSRDQGGINGVAHGGGSGAEFNIPLLLPHNLMDFMTVLHWKKSQYRRWYEILNLGYRISPTAGSDYPCGPNKIGDIRFYTKVNGDFTHNKWLKSVQAGRTYVTTGPVLDFTIDGKEMGSDIKLKKSGTVIIKGTVHFDRQRYDLNRIELVENGTVIASIPRKYGEDKITFAIKHKVNENSWFAIRSGESGPVSLIWPNMKKTTGVFHSAPTYVSIKNAAPMMVHPRAKAIARDYLAKLDDLESRMDLDNLDKVAERLAKIYFDAVSLEGLQRNRNALLAEIETARKYFRKIAQ